MKKIFLIISFILLSNVVVFAEDNYDTLYDKAQLFPSKLFNDIDPFEDEDSIKYAWSPYPLFRTSAYLYFKDFTIEPGYYILTPRTLKGNDYVFFKQGGKVKFIIPAAKTEKTPLNFYDANIPKVKQTKMQKFSTKVRNKFYKIAKDSMKSEPPKSLVNVIAEEKYIIIELYYGENKYVTVFKRTPY